MSEYVCPSCSRTSKLPDFCCGRSMVQRGRYYCDNCKAQSSSSGECCGSATRMI